MKITDSADSPLRRKSRDRRYSDSDNHRTSKRRKISEVEIAEYLAKKAQKKAKLNVYGYANESNPFVWSKKIERDGVSLEAFSVKSQRIRMAEFEKLKRRREERAVEKAQHEEEMTLLARQRARAELQDGENKEQEFLFYQSKLRSRIRLPQGRGKPIDVLSTYLEAEPSDGEIKEPCMVFKGLTVEDMEELQEDIKLHLDFDRATPTHIQYWEALVVVCDWELAVARKLDCAEIERGLHSSIVTDVRKLLLGKSFAQLENIHAQIESEMRLGTAKVVEYWEAVLKHIHIYKAKACLKEIHNKMLRKQLERLEQQPDWKYNIHMERHKTASPKVDHVLEGDEVLGQQKVTEEDTQVMGAMDNVDEVNVDSQVYLWHDKYRPRKPTYFSRVHTGYEWNQYNRTHYDHDNPPPKVVQGYKFHILYHDLIDKTKVPVYTIHKDGDSAETCIIRFHAGPPYEDIAFRIVNNEWEYSRKKGFKCKFEHEILHVCFNLKRFRYRR